VVGVAGVVAMAQVQVVGAGAGVDTTNPQSHCPC